MTGARHALWLSGAPARALLVALIKAYRVVLSGWLGGQCRFAPTRSHYAEVAITTHGATKGSVLAVWRLLRCNPYGKGGLDPIPPARAALKDESLKYESVIQSNHGPGVKV